MVLEYITLDKGFAQIIVDEPKSAKEIKEDKSLARQKEKQNKYKEIFGEFDESQQENPDIKQKEHIHEAIKNYDFINKMI